MDLINDTAMKVTPETGQESNPAGYVSETYFDPRLALPALVFGTLTVVLFVRLDFAWYWIGMAVIGALAVACTLQWRAFIEVDNMLVREEGRLFGGKLLAQRLIPLSNFEAVVFLHHKVADGEDWTVGIRHHSGRTIWVRRYLSNDPKHPAPGYAAEAFASAFSCKTNLKIEDYRPQKPGQWLRSFFRR